MQSIDYQILEIGWSDPTDLLSPNETAALNSLATASLKHFVPPRAINPNMPHDAFEQKPWFKSLHLLLPEFGYLAKRQELLGPVTRALGPDVILWGASISRKRPSEVHRWHVDIEHTQWAGITIYIPIGGSEIERAGLRFIDRSHKLRRPCDSEEHDDASVLAALSGHGTDVSISSPEIGLGQFVVFSGWTWHGSVNKSDSIRTAIILQYTVPSSLVAVPLEWNEGTTWHNHKPPCMLVSGIDRYGVNKLI